MTIDEAFNATIEYYDEWMRKAVPSYDEIFRTAQDLVPFDHSAPIEILDLGAGTGLFSEHVLKKYPKANFLLYDVADKMLGVARDRFREHSGQFHYAVGDYRKIQVSKEFDLVISSLSIHHLEDPEKRELFKKIHGVLKDAGAFINVDQVRGETPAVEELYWGHWLSQVSKAGFPEERIQESIDRRTRYDRDASLSDQLRWLKEAGFANVDCVFKSFFVALFLALK
jgi:tRNA (cmo5U34)-methyltransferase